MTGPALRILLAAALLAIVWGALPGLALLPGFSGHMLTHVVVVALVPPLLAPSLLDGARGLRVLQAAPLGASLFELVVVWGWHTPLLHDLADRSLLAYGLEQATFLLSGIMVWASALAVARSGRGGGALTGALALLMTSMHMTLLGALIGLAGRPLYGLPFCGGAPGWTGLSVLQDQQLGAAIMLSLGAAAYLAGGIVLLARLLGRDATVDREMAR